MKGTCMGSATSSSPSDSERNVKKHADNVLHIVNGDKSILLARSMVPYILLIRGGHKTALVLS